MSSTTLIRIRASLAPSPSAPQSTQTNAGPYFHYAGGWLRQFDLRQKCSRPAPVGGAVRRTQPAVGSDDARVGTMLSKKDFAGTSEQDDFKISLGYATLIQGFNPYDSIGAHFYSTVSPRCFFRQHRTTAVVEPGEVGPLAPRQIGGSRGGSGVSAGNRSRVEHMQFCVPHR